MKILIFIFLTLLISCKEKPNPQSDYYLTDEDKSWNIYHVGDTLKFLSNNNHNRIYIVENVAEGMRSQNFSNPESSKYEYLNILFRRIDTSFVDNYFCMDLVRGYQPNYLQFIIMIWWYDDLIFPHPFDLNMTANTDTLKVNNIVYNNVLKFYNYHYDTVNMAAKNIYYNKQKGWLRIERNTGETWDRIN